MLSAIQKVRGLNWRRARIGNSLSPQTPIALCPLRKAEGSAISRICGLSEIAGGTACATKTGYFLKSLSKASRASLALRGGGVLIPAALAPPGT